MQNYQLTISHINWDALKYLASYLKTTYPYINEPEISNDHRELHITGSMPEDYDYSENRNGCNAFGLMVKIRPSEVEGVIDEIPMELLPWNGIPFVMASSKSQMDDLEEKCWDRFCELNLNSFTLSDWWDIVRPDLNGPVIETSDDIPTSDIAKIYDLTKPIPDKDASEFMIPKEHRDGTVSYTLDPVRWQDYILNLIGCVCVDGALWFKDEYGSYTTDYGLFERIVDWSRRGSSSHQRKELYLSMKIVAPQKSVAHWSFAGFQGDHKSLQVLNLKNMELTELTGDGFLPNIVKTEIPLNSDGSIDWNYKDEAVEKFLSLITDGRQETLYQIEEMIGYPMLRGGNLRKCYILKGGLRNGKSTLIEAIANMYGSENCSSVNFEDLGGRFNIVHMLGKLANFGDDISSSYKDGDQVAIFKKIVSGSTITMEHKGVDVFESRIYAKLIFSANEIPRLDDKTGAALDRMIIVPMTHFFSEDDPNTDPFISDKLSTPSAKKALLIHGLIGLSRIIRKGRFTQSSLTTQELQDYDLSNSSVLQYLEFKDYEDAKAALLGKKPQDVYADYSDFCRIAGIKPYSQNAFTKDLERRLKIKAARSRVKMAGGTSRITLFVPADAVIRPSDVLDPSGMFLDQDGKLTPIGGD